MWQTGRQAKSVNENKKITSFDKMLKKIQHKSYMNTALDSAIYVYTPTYMEMPKRIRKWITIYYDDMEHLCAIFCSGVYLLFCHSCMCALNTLNTLAHVHVYYICVV